MVDVAIPKPRPGWKDRVEWLVEQGDTQDLLAVASQLERRLVGRQFDDWLLETVGSLQPLYPRLIQAISRLGIPVATTNYDTLITDITHRQAVTWWDSLPIDNWLNGRDDRILHLHGVFSRPNTVVLGLAHTKFYRRTSAHSLCKSSRDENVSIYWLRVRH